MPRGGRGDGGGEGEETVGENVRDDSSVGYSYGHSLDVATLAHI